MVRSIREANLKGKRVLIRVDFNVSLEKKTGEITDDTRIRAALPTIKYILERDASLVLMSHLGRPKGKPNPLLKMDKVGERLEELLGRRVKKLPGCVGEKVEREVFSLKAGEVALLENTRFYPEEEKNDPEFSRRLARLGDIYVNDAFGTAHRAHASTVGVAKYLPSYAGLLMEKELTVLGNLLSSPQKPFASVLGGAKVSDKLGVLKNLLSLCDCILIGGGMAYTFLKAKGEEVGDSLVEEEKVKDAGLILREGEKKNCQIYLPRDHVVAKAMEKGEEAKVVEKIPPGFKGLDIGPQTTEEFKKVLKGAKTVFWNGPMGVFEVEPFSQGTFEIARTLSRLEATTVVGGGDSVAALKKFGLEREMTHVSTGGGASLEFLKGRVLPGVEVLRK